MTKDEIKDLASKIESALLKVEGIEDLIMDDIRISLNDWDPNNKKYEKKYAYRSFEVSMNKKGELEAEDFSEPFKCSMGCETCTARGECNGDC